MAKKQVQTQLAIATKQIKLNVDTSADARQAALKYAICKVMLDSSVTNDETLISSAYDVGRLALALKLAAVELGGPDGLFYFEQGFTDDVGVKNKELDAMLFD